MTDPIDPYTGIGLYLWVAYAFVSGFIAKSKDRDFLLYFWCSIIFSPLIAVPLIIGLTDARKPK